MAAQRYEISLRVLKYFFSKRREISYLQAAMQCSFYYINTNEIPNHFTLIVFWYERRDLLCSHSKDDIFTCEDNMLFLHVKISSFRAKAHLVFHWCLYNKPTYVKKTYLHNKPTYSTQNSDSCKTRPSQFIKFSLQDGTLKGYRSRCPILVEQLSCPPIL